MKSVSRAFHDTFDGRFVRAAFLLIGGALFSFGTIYLILGSEEAMLETPYILAGLVGTVGPIVLLFMYNLACAPYRNERDLRIAAQNEAAEYKSKIPLGPLPRTLDAEQKASLADTIRNSGIRPKSINVCYDPVSAECADFAADISDAIEMAGIHTVVHDGALLSRNVKDRGIKIYSGKAKTTQLLADAFFEYFKVIGLSPERRNVGPRENLFLDVCRSGKTGRADSGVTG